MYGRGKRSLTRIFSIKGIIYLISCECCGKREIPSCNPPLQCHDIRRCLFMFTGEHLPASCQSLLLPHLAIIRYCTLCRASYPFKYPSGATSILAVPCTIGSIISAAVVSAYFFIISSALSAHSSLHAGYFSY